MIRVENLTKRFGRTVAVDDLTFDVGHGEIVGFLGPNGAGKTTTMRILAGFLPPTSGSVTVAGLDVQRDSIEVRRRTGYLPESMPLYTDMRVEEYLRYRGRLKGMSTRDLRARLAEVAESCGLTSELHTVIGRLSKGYRQRVGLADSLLHDPDLLILDEPTIGLDPNQIRQVRGILRGLGEQHTVLLSSHILSEVEMICHRVLIIDHGRIIAADTTENLLGVAREHGRVVVEIRGPRHDVLDAIGKVDGVGHVSWDDDGEWNRLTCDCRDGAAAREAIFNAVVEHGWALREMREERQNLEDIFVSLTGSRSAPTTDAEEEGPGS